MLRWTKKENTYFAIQEVNCKENISGNGKRKRKRKSETRRWWTQTFKTEIKVYHSSVFFKAVSIVWSFKKKSN